MNPLVDAESLEVMVEILSKLIFRLQKQAKTYVKRYEKTKSEKDNEKQIKATNEYLCLMMAMDMLSEYMIRDDEGLDSIPEVKRVLN